MKAAQYYGPRDLRIADIEEPQVRADHDVKIQVAYAGICGSDVHFYTHGREAAAARRPDRIPVVPGHEFSGTVVATGAAVRTVAPGDRVAVEPLRYNPDDPAVRAGRYNLANELGGLGGTEDGGLAQYAIAHERMVHRLPDSVSLLEGALVEPTAVGFYAVASSRIAAADHVAVFGAGPVGLAAVMAARAAGATQLVAVDKSARRLAMASKVGATSVINLNAGESAAALAGMDVVVDAAGVQASLDQGLSALRKGGQLAVVALPIRVLQLDLARVVQRHIDIQGFVGYNNVFPRVIELVAARVFPVGELVTKTIALDDLVQEGILPLTADDPAEVKVLIDLSLG
jgi:(R,R)-butanediol dehydrogenase/meso-butanediol dehydrogenase/diacetyl reductase